MRRNNPIDPPAEYRFKPGQSGNPGGRRKWKPICDTLARLLEQDTDEGRTRAESIARAWLAECEAGNIGALRELLDRLEGKVPNPPPLKAEEDEPPDDQAFDNHGNPLDP